MTEALTAAAAAHLVPAGYAEKAMASLMQLHAELMEEKERRVDLFRRLMEREQALAELRMYVKVMEEKLAGVVRPAEGRPAAPAAPEARPGPEAAPEPVAVAPVRPVAEAPRRVPPVPPRINARPRLDGWKSW